MNTNRIPFVSAMQQAMFNAALRAGAHNPLALRVARAVDRARPLMVREFNANVSYRTAQKLKAEGVL